MRKSRIVNIPHSDKPARINSAPHVMLIDNDMPFQGTLNENHQARLPKR